MTKANLHDGTRVDDGTWAHDGTRVDDGTWMDDGSCVDDNVSDDEPGYAHDKRRTGRRR
jgi:hypothetical protein